MVQSPAPVRAPAYRFTVADYYAMAEAGIFHEDDRVELVAGEVVQMVPIGSRHSGTVDRLNRALLHVEARAIVRVQSPVRLDEHSEPQPDVTLLRPRDDFYTESHPGPADVILIIEVMQASADYDRSVKLPLYAQAGIPEVWLVDLEADAVEVCRWPDAAEYRERALQRRGETLSVPGIDGVMLPVEQILG